MQSLYGMLFKHIGYSNLHIILNEFSVMDFRLMDNTV